MSISDTLSDQTILCDLCHHPMISHWNVRDCDDRPWSYLKCSHCQLVQLFCENKTSNWDKISYPESYYGEGYSKFTGAIQWLREFSAWRRAREIHCWFRKPGQALDIGCGEGLFLKWMKYYGWQVTGCEIDEQSAKRAEQSLRSPIHRGEFKTMQRPDALWDVVMLWHVLEHVPMPTELLKGIADVTAQNGILVIAIPNAFSWQARLFGSHWFHLDPPRHLYSFGLPHLKQMAKQTGWELFGSHFFSLEYNPFGWAQSFLNALGWRRDAMYERLKRHSQFHISDIFLRILAWLLLGPSILPAVLEAIVGRGGTVTCYFRKI